MMPQETLGPVYSTDWDRFRAAATNPNQTTLQNANDMLTHGWEGLTNLMSEGWDWAKPHLDLSDPRNTGGTAEDGTKYAGWMPTMASAFSNAFNAWNNHQNLQLAKEQFDFLKGDRNRQFNIQRNLLHSQLRDRQEVRQREAGAMSADEYMQRNGFV